MALDINLKIYMPEKIVLNQDVYRAVLAYDNKTITIMKDRAPTLISLDMGMIQILDETNTPIDEYYISGGVADMKLNTCTILTESAFRKADLDLEKVIALNEEFCNPFFTWLVNIYTKESNLNTLKSSS